MQPFQTAFIAEVAPGAQASQKQYGIPASVTIAQAILESGWGKHLPTGSNNLFGIQAPHNAAIGTYVEAESTEFVDGVQQPSYERFARYDSITDSITAHAGLIANNARYRPAMNAASDPAAYADELKRCGYSTTPDYANRLMEIVQDYDLTQYDHAPVSVA